MESKKRHLILDVKLWADGKVSLAFYKNKKRQMEFDAIADFHTTIKGLLDTLNQHPELEDL